MTSKGSRGKFSARRARRFKKLLFLGLQTIDLAYEHFPQISRHALVGNRFPSTSMTALRTTAVKKPRDGDSLSASIISIETKYKGWARPVS